MSLLVLTSIKDHEVSTTEKDQREGWYDPMYTGPGRPGKPKETDGNKEAANHRWVQSLFWWNWPRIIVLDAFQCLLDISPSVDFNKAISRQYTPSADGEKY